MRVLIDSHVLWWSIVGSPALGADARTMIEDPANRIWISPVTLWELEMKRVVGKLRWTGDLLAESLERGALELPITLQHARRAARLPRHHTDPFDRMLVAQAQLEGLKLLTADREISRYEIEILPARD